MTDPETSPKRRGMPLFDRSSCAAFALVVLGMAASVTACSSSSSDSGGPGSSSGSSGGTGTGSQTVSADDCARRCESKFKGCGADDTSAKDGCSAQVCKGNVTGDQLTCLENKSCDQISGAASFSALCPASTTTEPEKPAGATCGKATCASGEYCGLTYDSSTSAWSPGSCKKVPAACENKGAGELCTCMKDNSGCSTSGVILTKCSQSNGALSFGCQ